VSFAQISLKGRALRYLAAREYSRLELATKLKKYEEIDGELAAALDELEAKGFISEARVVASTLHQKAPRFGAARILHDLKAKGIDSTKVAEASASLKETELDRAYAVWQRKFDAPSDSPNDYAKQARFLATRGFSGEVVGRVLKMVRQTLGTDRH
jgi:regulatory protein